MLSKIHNITIGGGGVSRLFTCRPLHYQVYRVVLVYSLGTVVTGISLLQTSRKDLLALDFEGVLKYFRVQLPKKYRSDESARELLQIAIGLKVSRTDTDRVRMSD